MNELLNHLNNYTKKRKNKHRFSAVMVCLAVIVSFTVYIGLIEPAESASGQLACGMEEHEHTQDCFELICGFDDESEEEISVDTTEIGSEETTETTCETEETTTEKTETTTSTEAEETTPVHVHSDKCYRLICLTEAHLHKQDCYNQPVETTEPAATETSASISTGTTTSTEQTTETTTTTTELSEEIHELNAALFGELYMDRVNILADAQTITKDGEEYPYYLIDEYKFYYKNGNLHYNEYYFKVNPNPAYHPACNITDVTGVTYNNTTYKTVYTFERNTNRYIKFKSQNEDGTLIFVFNKTETNVKVQSSDGTLVEKEFNGTEDSVLTISVKANVEYTLSEPTGTTSKARLAYAEFIPAVKTEEYKFYYDDEKILHYNECFSYPDGTDGPNANTVTPNLEVVYNGNTYTNTYNFNKTEARYITLTAPQNGTLLLAFDGGNYNINVLKTGDTEPKSYSCNNSDQNVIAVPVVANGEYKIYQNSGNDNARLAYAEFVPTVTPVDGGTYRIRNVKTGLYIEVEDAGTINRTKIKTGQYSYDDNRNDFKFADAGDENFYIYPQLDYSNSANGIQMLDYSSSGDIQTYSTGDIQSNRKFKFNFNNDNGTYKINSYVRKSTTVVNLYVDNNYVKASETATGDDFIIVEATEMVKPEVVYPVAEIDPNTTYLIKNVRSRLYVHNDDGNIVQQKDVGVESQFRFENKGDGKYYIHLPAADEWMTIGVENIENEADVKLSWSNNSFYAEQMENGSVRFYQENNGKKYYLGIPYTTVAAGANIALYEAESVEDQMCFFLEPIVENINVDESRTRVEARVIFADYNDGKFELYKDTDDKVISGEKQAGDVKTNERNLYDEPAWTPTIELYKGNESNPIYTEKGNLVIDVSEARKDWCYQYNYVWNLGTDTTNEYTVKLNGVNSGNKITLNGKEFNVYYLKDTELNHPGNNGNSNAPAEAYKQTPYSQAGDQIIYIFLDPVVEQWWGGTNPPATFDLSMKKRWDGHNSDGFDNRKKEKIQIQLQKLVTENGVEKWVEYNPTKLNDDYRSIIYYEKDNVSNNFVDKTFTYNNVPLVSADVPEDQRLTRVVPGEGEVPWETPDDKYVNKTVLEQAQGAKDGATVDKANRLELVLHYNEWNNVILSYDKGNKPSHFQEGYYMNWKALPYGNYRVIETMSFYDANENDVFDEGDRDTSNEYYYMSYPPMRDSRGVLHIQNFTKDMVLDIHKEWYDNTGTEKMDNPGKTVKVNIYRSLEKLSDPSVAKLGVPIYSDVEVTGDNVILKTTAGYDKLLLKTTSEQKYYYYIQEVSVDGYLLLNGNNEGFVK